MPPLHSGEQTPLGADGSDLRAKLGGPTLPDGFAGVGGATAEAKAPGICAVVGRGLCFATALGRSGSIRIAGVFCSTPRGAVPVEDRAKGEVVAGTASGGGGCGEFFLDNFPDEMELDLVTPR